MGESRGRWHHLTDADQFEILEGLRSGAALDAVAKAVGCARCTIQHYPAVGRPHRRSKATRGSPVGSAIVARGA